MAKNGFELRGFKELERALAEELPKTTRRNVLVRTAMDAMDPLKARMAQLAPRDEADRNADGEHLADSMRTQVITSKLSKRGAGTVDRQAGVSVITGPAPKGKRARANAGWQEDGTVNMPANAYARPAVDAEAMGVLERVRDALATQIGKAKERIARKAARRGF